LTNRRFDAAAVGRWDSGDIVEHYDAHRTILYALGIGAGRGEDDAPYVDERRLDVFPTLPLVLASEGFWFADPRTGIDCARILHDDQSLTLHARIPPAGEVVGRMRVDALYDRGPGRSAMLRQTRVLKDAATGAMLATMRGSIVLRGHGGFGGPAEPATQAAQVPDRAPDASLADPTRPEQAALYRLSGDLNPLHLDHEVARRAGFERPLLHGLCSFGFAARAVVALGRSGDAAELAHIEGRFSAPVFPGDTLTTDIWRDNGGCRFRVRVAERDETVIDGGRAEFR
jgi:acyl dehydratase